MFETVKKIIKSNRIPFNKDIALDYLNNSNELYYEAINLYIKNYSDIEKPLTKYLLEQNYSEIFKIIHKIKGVSIYTGCLVLHQYTTYLQQKLYSNDYFNIDNEIKLLIELNNLVIVYLKEEVNYEKRIINCK